MKKIIIGLAVIAAVGAVVVYGTGAYFSDTETSTNNTFAAGSLDLIVDVNGVIQNPLSGPIFSVADMKPGDSGEQTISLRVDNNPACGFVNFNLTSDLDNTCTEPEVGDEPACAVDNLGELNDNVVWTIWSDMGIWKEQTGCPEEAEPGDNIYNPECGDVELTTGNLVGDKSWSIGELPVTPAIQYYGIKWELPWAVNNIAQTDSFTADMIINALQKRNQFPNGCPALGLIPSITS